MQELSIDMHLLFSTCQESVDQTSNVALHGPMARSTGQKGHPFDKTNEISPSPQLIMLSSTCAKFNLNFNSSEIQMDLTILNSPGIAKLYLVTAATFCEIFVLGKTSLMKQKKDP